MVGTTTAKDPELLARGPEIKSPDNEPSETIRISELEEMMGLEPGERVSTPNNPKLPFPF